MTNSDLILVLGGTGRNAATTGGVVEALGRPRRDFAEFAAAARGSR